MAISRTRAMAGAINERIREGIISQGYPRSKGLQLNTCNKYVRVYDMTMTKTHARFTAIELRKLGHSYNYIAPMVGVSKGSLSVWLADVAYTPNEETVARIGKALAASGEVKSQLKRASLQAARDEAVKDMGTLTRRDVFMLGLGLYMGEGAKSTITTCMVNANPRIITLTIRWLVEALGLRRENMRMRLHIYPDTDEDHSLNYWMQQTGIPREQFQRSVIDWRKDKKVMKAGKLPHGTAHLTVHSLGDKRFGVFLARKIAAYSEIVLGT